MAADTAAGRCGWDRRPRAVLGPMGDAGQVVRHRVGVDRHRREASAPVNATTIAIHIAMARSRPRGSGGHPPGRRDRRKTRRRARTSPAAASAVAQAASSQPSVSPPTRLNNSVSAATRTPQQTAAASDGTAQIDGDEPRMRPGLAARLSGAARRGPRPEPGAPVPPTSSRLPSGRAWNGEAEVGRRQVPVRPALAREYAPDGVEVGEAPLAMRLDRRALAGLVPGLDQDQLPAAGDRIPIGEDPARLSMSSNFSGSRPVRTSALSPCQGRESHPGSVTGA